mgnify:CR=1 FL=1
MSKVKLLTIVGAHCLTQYASRMHQATYAYQLQHLPLVPTTTLLLEDLLMLLL